MFDQELRSLETEMLSMASMVEELISESVESLRRQDRDAARAVIDKDREINKKRFEIEANCLIVIATQQPVASDLRLLAAILHIVSELERIGDYAKGIGRITIMIGKQPLMKPLIDIPRMAEAARSMLHQAIEAFVQRDVDAALAIPAQDEIVDGLYNQVYRELITYVISEPRNIDQMNYLLWVAHNLERTADRVVNVCERVVFAVTGEIGEIDSDTDGLESLA
jgi:phosphate transport system protein